MAAEDREKMRALLQDTAAVVQVVAKAYADVCRIMIRLRADT
jgi:hypothetical protein